MSLRRALEALPDDRDTRSAAYDIVSFFGEHPNEAIDGDRIARATGIPPHRVHTIVAALSNAFVIDCGGSIEDSPCTFAPSPILSLEVQRFLRTGTGRGGGLQRGAQRFRDRYGGR